MWTISHARLHECEPIFKRDWSLRGEAILRISKPWVRHDGHIQREMQRHEHFNRFYTRRWIRSAQTNARKWLFLLTQNRYLPRAAASKDGNWSGRTMWLFSRRLPHRQLLRRRSRDLNAEYFNCDVLFTAPPKQLIFCKLLS